jgi:DNA polymerase-3 subunit epsilon
VSRRDDAAARGVELRPAEMLLVERARDYLKGGPARVEALIGHVCQLPAPPRSVAEHMAMALLGPFPEFARDAEGMWRLASRDPVAAPPPACSSIERLLDLSYVVVDVETTGGRPDGGDRITEIAAVRVAGGEVREVYETLVNPERSIPLMITRLTNISWNMVKDAPRFREIVPQLGDVLRGHVFVAHNAVFDWRFVSAELARATGERLEGRRLCTVRLARRLLPQLPRRSLDVVARHYGVEIAARHRAAGDAVATAHVLLALLRDAAERGCESWESLDALLTTAARSPRRRRRSAMPAPVDRDPTI